MIIHKRTQKPLNPKVEDGKYELQRVKVILRVMNIIDEPKEKNCAR